MLTYKTEEAMSRQLARYLQVKHPELDGLYHFDFGSGLKMSKSQAVRQALLNRRSWPDLLIAVPKSYGAMQGQTLWHSGLFIELKREGTRLTKRDGTWASEHIAEQAAELERLRDQGYIATFACGLDEAIEMIESYLDPDRNAVQEAEAF